MSSLRDLAQERLNVLSEDSLAALGEQRIVLGRLERAQKNIEALAAARRIERAELVADIAHLREDVRQHEERLVRLDEIAEHCDELGLEQMQIIVEAEHQVSEDQRVVSIAAKDAGFTYGRQELIAKGAPALLERRRQRVADAGATQERGRGDMTALARRKRLETALQPKSYHQHESCGHWCAGYGCPEKDDCRRCRNQKFNAAARPESD